jgi:hypothetical protein
MEFDIDTEGKGDLELHLQFHNFVIDKFRKGGNVALIFDEAQNLHCYENASRIRPSLDHS